MRNLFSRLVSPPTYFLFINKEDPKKYPKTYPKKNTHKNTLKKLSSKNCPQKIIFKKSSSKNYPQKIILKKLSSKNYPQKIILKKLSSKNYPHDLYFGILPFPLLYEGPVLANQKSRKCFIRSWRETTRIVKKGSSFNK